MKLITCSECGEFHYTSEQICPHCNTFHPAKQDSQKSSRKRSFAPNAILLGLALTGCGDKTEDTSTDTASEPTAEPTSEPAIESDYGVPDTGLTEE
jgi:hypothetical protein